MLKVLMVGDVVGPTGVERLTELLPNLRFQEALDLVVVNGENSAAGNGILPSSAQALFLAGADVITSGNHALRRREIYEYFSDHPALIRPGNFHETAPGAGLFLWERPPLSVAVLNLQGRVFMDTHYSPFDLADKLLETVKTPLILVDFHAEATSEKLALAHYLDGRVSLLCGTHTHVPTADARILPAGTGYVTDLGMCGGKNSVLGVRRELAIARQRTGLPTRFENDPEEIGFQGIIAEIDKCSGKTTKIRRLDL